MTNLNPCPFCGAESEVEELWGDFSVSCKNCHCRGRLERTKALAIQAWNARTDTSHTMQEEMLSMLLELQECSEYWVDRLNAVIAKARGENA